MDRCCKNADLQKNILNVRLQNKFEPIVKADKTKVEKSKERAN